MPHSAHSAGWQGVGVGMLVRHCYWGGRSHLDCESARLATLHLPGCLPPCITIKHVLPCCSSNRIRATSHFANTWFCWKFFNTIIRVGNEDENLQNFVPHCTFAWKMSTLWLWSANEDLPTLRRFCISLKIKCCVGLVSNAKYTQTYFHLFKENKNRKTRIDNPKQTSPVQRD